MPDHATQLERYQALVEVLEVLARATHSVEDVVAAIHEQMSRLIHTHVTVLGLRRGGVWICDVMNERERFTQELPIDPNGLSEQVYRNGSLYVPDVQAYLEERGLIVRNLHGNAQPTRVRSYLATPIDIEGQRTGVLSVQSDRPGAFVPLDLHFLELLAKHVSIALDHAHLRERLEQQARTDSLTRLLNRHAFTENAPRAIAHAERYGLPVTVVMIDVQNFKDINDTAGHDTGDAVLGGLAACMREAVRASDSVYRLGGDEFALLLDTDDAGAKSALQRLQALMQAYPWPREAPLVRVNAGVSQWNPGQDAQTWLRAADRRMYDAKAQGRLITT